MNPLPFLASQPLAVLLLCLAAGAFLGRVRIGFLPANATLATLLVAISANLCFAFFGCGFRFPKSLASFEQYTLSLQSMSFAFFSFAMGYSAGPGFRESVRRDGLSAVFRPFAVALAYCVSGGLAAFAVVSLFPVPSPAAFRGLLAGALTQTTLLDPSCAGQADMMVAYGVAYVVGVSSMILFVQAIAPRLLRTPLATAVKRHLDAGGSGPSPAAFQLPVRVIQMRAYRILPGTPLVGSTVAALEAVAPRRFEIVALHRGGGDAPLSPLTQDTVLHAGDVLVAVGDRRIIRTLPLERVEETVDDVYLSANFILAEIVLSGPDPAGAVRALTGRGILPRAVLRDGRPLPESRLDSLLPGDVLQVAGLDHSVSSFAREYGYLRDSAATPDLVAVSSAVALAVILGALSLFGISLGTGCCALVLGLACGAANRRFPRFGHIPPPALALMRSFGLNVFIACVALGATLDPGAVFSRTVFKTLLAAAVLAVFPLLGTFLFGRFVLRMPPVPLLGSICGAGTCTPALNALEEETGSSAFTPAYTLPYVFGNVLLTLLGPLAARILY